MSTTCGMNATTRRRFVVCLKRPPAGVDGVTATTAEWIREQFAGLSAEDQLGFTLWLWSEYHSNKIEGEHETARNVALILQALASDLRSHELPSTEPPEPF